MSPALGRTLRHLACLLFGATAAAASTDATLPTLIYPRDGQTTPARTVPVLGRAAGADKSVQVTLRGQDLALTRKADGVFRGAAELRPGLNTLYLERREIRVFAARPGEEGPPGFVEIRLHPPVEESCSSCHASSPGPEYRLREKGAALCIGCHPDPRVAPDGKPFAAHRTAARGGCVACHEPHASAQEP